jgi:integrase
MRALLAVAHNFAWRKGELLPLRVRQIDLQERTIRLDVGTTKNGRGRTVRMTQEVFTLLSACVLGKKPHDFVFTRANGRPVRDFRKTWESVCVRAGVGHQLCVECDEVLTGEKCECGNDALRYEGLIFHDLRRTGVRNLRRLGIAESVAMKISGHRTAAVFRRYDITDDNDLADAAARIDAKQKSPAPSAPAFATFGQSSGRIGENSSKNDASMDLRPSIAPLPN